MGGHRASGKPLRPLLACADDLGVASSSDNLILNLLRDGRLSGASLLVDAPNAAEAGAAARGLRLGLHLNLSQPFGQAFATRHVGRWIQAAWSGRISPSGPLADQLRAEIDRQLEWFARCLGRPPDHVDGHEHVHGLPGIAPLLAERLARAGLGSVPVRSVRARRWRGAKAELISRLCGSPGATPQNDDFLGVYDFGAHTPYGQLVASWLRAAGERPLLMCHPGDGAGAMPHAAARAAEAAFLASDAWPRSLAAAGRRLVAPAARGSFHPLESL